MVMVEGVVDEVVYNDAIVDRIVIILCPLPAELGHRGAQRSSARRAI
jgi:hypothetical protein